MAAPPPGYSPDASLLPVGSGPITAMQGGGMVGGAISTPIDLLKQIRDELRSSVQLASDGGEKAGENAAYAKILLIAADTVIPKIVKGKAVTEKESIEADIDVLQGTVDGLSGISETDIAEAKKRFQEKTGIGPVMQGILREARRAIDTAYPALSTSTSATEAGEGVSDEAARAAEEAAAKLAAEEAARQAAEEAAAKLAAEEATKTKAKEPSFRFDELSHELKMMLSASVVKPATNKSGPLPYETVVERLIERGIGLFLGTEQTTKRGDIQVEVYMENTGEVVSGVVEAGVPPVFETKEMAAEAVIVPEQSLTKRVVSKEVEEARRRIRTGTLRNQHRSIREKYGIDSTHPLDEIPTILEKKLGETSNSNTRKQIGLDLRKINIIIEQQKQYGNVLQGGGRRTRRLRKTLPLGSLEPKGASVLPVPLAQGGATPPS